MRLSSAYWSTPGVAPLSVEARCVPCPFRDRPGDSDRQTTESAERDTRECRRADFLITQQLTATTTRTHTRRYARLRAERVGHTGVPLCPVLTISNYPPPEWTWQCDNPRRERSNPKPIGTANVGTMHYLGRPLEWLRLSVCRSTPGVAPTLLATRR